MHKSIRNIVFTPTKAEPVFSSWLAEFQTKKDGPYSTNALRFATKEEAEAYGRDLFSRWTATIDFQIVLVSDPVNYKFEDGRAQRLDGPLGTI